MSRLRRKVVVLDLLAGKLCSVEEILHLRDRQHFIEVHVL